MNAKTKTRREPKIRSERLWTQMSATLRERLSSYCGASHLTERAVIEEAVEQYISGTSDMTLVLRRLERLGRAADRAQRDVEVLSAAFAVFVQLWFAHHPSPRDEVKPAAREEAESRYQKFVEYVGSEFTGGRRFVDDLPRDAVADDAELDAMAANAGTARRMQ